jgi:hypothetical protein
MVRVNDVRAKPGDIVLTRGAGPVTVYRNPNGTEPAATIMPGGLGLVVNVDSPAWTYVLWSMPCVMGWVPDGQLRRIKT